ncbi:DNA methyltransferase [Romboutsia sp. 1001713B170207_170306_H8]|uniref:DNA methyltransferase n=1 Tax=Romboutsia sp. 1001713B170207_170306_H8 TaxID=2787112 RepID=UPI00189A6F70|nr:site-specific DNA-methyltransferase [Romboutsia sp. 1001713B170207_170306_H8]
MNRSKQRFYTSMTSAFLGDVGKKIEGNSGYTNLMHIKNLYFAQVIPLIDKEIDSKFNESNKEEAYNKLYTFFDSYLNETGTPFFYNTQIHKNLYDKVYSDTKDVSLFWKTRKLFYVKSEALYTSLNFEIDGVKFNFDASNITHQSNNEKKSLEFILSNIIWENDKNEITFKVFYKQSNPHKLLAEKIDMKSAKLDSIRKEISKKLLSNEEFYNNTIIFNKNNLDISAFIKRDGAIDADKFKYLANIYSTKEGLLDYSLIEIGINITEENDLARLEYYASKQSIDINLKTIKKAISTYKKQNEIDYFVHKDSQGFLREQFNLYLYNYLFSGDHNLWSEERINEISKLKEVAYKIIDYISDFEEELKQIWLKPKFVKKSNYVFTIDKISENIELIQLILENKGFESQINEWKLLHKDEENKRTWKEFKIAETFNKDDLLITEEGKVKVNKKYKYLPIDTKNFKDIEGEILSHFKNLDDILDGVLIKSDNYQALSTIMNKYRNNIELTYIDPPFNTGEDFPYKDGYQDSTWLSIMSDRLALSHELLGDDGSIYLHLGEDASYMGRILLENIFGEDCYQNNIIWAYTLIGGNAKKFERNHEYITWFSKTPKGYIFNKDEVRQPYSEKFLKSIKLNEEGKLVYTRGAGRDGEKLNRKKETEINPLGKAPSDVWDDINYVDDEELVERLRQIYGVKSDIWQDIAYMPPTPERIGFATQKPEELLYRIISASSNKGGRVLDFFSGSGTTICTAHKLERKWIGIEMGEHFDNVVVPRLKRVLAGHDSSISKKVKWKGGGMFKYYELEQYEDVLKNAKYTFQENINLFYNSDKLIDVLKIDENKEVAYLDFKELYPDIDIAETISNLTGKTITTIDSDKAVFNDGSTIELNNMKWDENKNLKPLFWWGK